MSDGGYSCSGRSWVRYLVLVRGMVTIVEVVEVCVCVGGSSVGSGTGSGCSCAGGNRVRGRYALSGRSRVSEARGGSASVRSCSS